MMSTRQLAWWLAALAALQFIAGAAALPDLMPAVAAQWIQVIVGALDAATAVIIGRSARPRERDVEWRWPIN
jgi:hypothetical protein